MMKHEAVDSSTVKSVAYDPAASRMEVKFHNGTTYSYADVPAHVHANMMDSDSVGKFLNSKVNGKYDHRKH